MKLLASAAILAALVTPALAASDITVDAPMAFPESLSATADGTVYIGLTKGAVYRAMPGEATAKPFISKDAGHFGIVLGVLTDSATDTLWVCDNAGKAASLKTFSLKTGISKKTYAFPRGGICNDIALKGRDAYITDTRNGRILKLAAGSDTLTTWYVNDASDQSLDGLVWQNGALYTNTYNGNNVIRVSVNPDGSAGKGVNLKTSTDVYQPDGMRLSADGKILMIEGRGKDGNGRLDEVTVNGDTATIKVIKDRYMIPAAVTVVGDTAYVLEAKFNYQRDPALKGKDPAPFKAYAVPLK
jgi:hypothetical protein